MTRLNLHRRLAVLERQCRISGPIVLLMPDGRTETLRNNVLDLFASAFHGDRTPQVELIAQSISSIEPDGSHMIDLVRAVLNSP